MISSQNLKEAYIGCSLPGSSLLTSSNVEEYSSLEDDDGIFIEESVDSDSLINDLYQADNNSASEESQICQDKNYNLDAKLANLEVYKHTLIADVGGARRRINTIPCPNNAFKRLEKCWDSEENQELEDEKELMTVNPCSERLIKPSSMFVENDSQSKHAFS